MVFRRVETLILSLPSRRNTIFYKIDVFEKDSKKVGFSLNFGGQKLRKISKNGCPNTSNFCTSIFLRFFTIFTDFGSILGGSGASKNHKKLLKIDFLVVCDCVWNFSAFWEAIWEGFWWIFDDFGGYFGVVGEFSGMMYRLGLVVCETLSRTNFFTRNWLGQIVCKTFPGTNRLKNVFWDKSFEKNWSETNRLKYIVWDKSFEKRCLGQIVWKTLSWTNRLEKRGLGQIV